MPTHVVAIERENELQHFISVAQDPVDLRKASPGITVKAFHTLSPQLGDVLRPVIGNDPEAVVKMTAGDFRFAMGELFAQGRHFADTRAESLPPFASAKVLVPGGDSDYLKNEDVVPLQPCHSDARQLSAEMGLLSYHFVSTFEMGMRQRISDMQDYPHYFVTARNGSQLHNFITDAHSMSRIAFVAKKGGAKNPHILITHRLKPSLQELLSHEDNNITFDGPRFDGLAESLRTDGRKLFETYGSALPPRRTPFPLPEAMETNPTSILSSVHKDLRKTGRVVLDCSDIRCVITELMTEGRNDAWRDAYSKGA